MMSPVTEVRKVLFVALPPPSGSECESEWLYYTVVWLTEPVVFVRTVTLWDKYTYRYTPPCKRHKRHWTVSCFDTCGYIQSDWALTPGSQFRFGVKYSALRTHWARRFRLCWSGFSVCWCVVLWPPQLVLTFTCSLCSFLCFPLQEPVSTPAIYEEPFADFKVIHLYLNPPSHALHIISAPLAGKLHASSLTAPPFLLVYKNDEVCYFSPAAQMSSSITMVRVWIESMCCKQNPLCLTIADIVMFLLWLTSARA